MPRQLSLRIVDGILKDNATPNGEGRLKATHKLFLPPLHSFAMGRSSAGSQTRLRLVPPPARPHPCLRLLRSTFLYQHPKIERATAVFRNTHMRTQLLAWILQMTKHTPTSPTVVPLLWCRLLVLHHRRSVMFVHGETKLVYHKETSIMTKTAMPRNPSQVSGKSSHVDAVRDPFLTQLCSCSVVLLCHHERTSSRVAGHFFTIEF